MTDNEIIKALECCSEPAGKCCCEVCPLHHREDSCTTALIKMTVELVNRQKAEIERLKEDVNFHIRLAGLLAEQRDGRDKLIGQIDAKNDELQKSLQTAKSEAIKEFAERLKNELMSNDLYKTHPIFESDVELFIDLMDNLVKEMEGK